MNKNQAMLVVPSPEVKAALPEKRKYRTAQFKLRILKEVDALKGQTGAIGELLRREGVYSSQLTEWRKARESGALSALSKKRGRKAKASRETLELERKDREIRRLEARLRQANLIIEAQKKISEILGLGVSESASEEEQL